MCCVLQAFDVLERLDPTQQMYEAKRGAAVGAFQMVVAGKEEVGAIESRGLPAQRQVAG